MENPDKIILSIEDDVAIVKFLKTYLMAQKFNFFPADTAAEGLRLLEKHHADVVLLDLGLPDMDGLELIKKIRSFSEVPIIVISARGREQDKAIALDSGANDYLTKPFGVVELSARIRVALRYAKLINNDISIIETGNLKIDLVNQQTFLDGEDLELPPKEFAILALLARNLGQVVTNQRLLQEVWGEHAEKEYLRIYVHHLRRKLEKDPTQPKYLHTRTGVGYQLWFDVN